MRHTISLELEELNPIFIENLKAYFRNLKSPQLTIIVDDEDETDYLLKSEANKDSLLKSIENARNKNFVTPNLDEFRNLIHA